MGGVGLPEPMKFTSPRVVELRAKKDLSITVVKISFREIPGEDERTLGGPDPLDRFDRFGAQACEERLSFPFATFGREDNRSSRNVFPAALEDRGDSLSRRV
jgi:hypothetical protein